MLIRRVDILNIFTCDQTSTQTRAAESFGMTENRHEADRSRVQALRATESTDTTRNRREADRSRAQTSRAAESIDMRENRREAERLRARKSNAIKVSKYEELNLAAFHYNSQYDYRYLIRIYCKLVKMPKVSKSTFTEK